MLTPIGDVVPFGSYNSSWKYVTKLGWQCGALAAWYALANLLSSIFNRHTSFHPSQKLTTCLEADSASQLLGDVRMTLSLDEGHEAGTIGRSIGHCQIFWVRSEDRLSLYLLSSELTLIGTKTVHQPGVL